MPRYPAHTCTRRDATQTPVRSPRCGPGGKGRWFYAGFIVGADGINENGMPIAAQLPRFMETDSSVSAETTQGGLRVDMRFLGNGDDDLEDSPMRVPTSTLLGIHHKDADKEPIS